ncbi:glycosyltransferase family 4 protein [Anabaena sp. CCY 9910]|uniref:glycosyltransferase family 4 protein n=1 Tax=Anabaena sp. CCY 9910 TaxID=3103870 RepID=UPI0039E00451
MVSQTYKLLFVSTPIGALGTGLGGGVELTLFNIAQEFLRRGHKLEIVAPQGSAISSLPIKEIPGKLQLSAQNQNRTDPIFVPTNSVLANMWDYARQVQTDYDLIVNFSYDWLPLYLTPFFHRPIAHLISMGSLTDVMDDMIEKVANNFPGTIGVHGKTQAATFTFAEKCHCLLNGLDISAYTFCGEPSSALAWVGRIAPEKGLEDAVAAANITGIPLKIFGLKQNEAYWEQICQTYPDAPIEYVGFLSTHELQHQLGQCRAVFITPRWIEAYPNVALEALACGVPLIAYSRGGLTEIVQDGKTGFLVEPDSVEGLVEAIHRLNEIDRRACRQQAETQYSSQAMGDRMEQWFKNILMKF